MTSGSPTVALLAIAVTLASVAPAAAADRQRAVVLYGPEADGEGLEERALAAFNLYSPDLRVVPTARPVGTALSDVADVELHGVGAVRTCPGSPVPLDSFQAALDGALPTPLRGPATLRIEVGGLTLAGTF